MDTDPCEWTVDDVQEFFRGQATAYIQDLPRGKLPQLNTFLPTLETVEVDGYTLLSVVDNAALREDCGIRDLHERTGVLRCIAKLRQRSAIYATENGLKLPSPPIQDDAKTTDLTTLRTTPDVSAQAPQPLTPETAIRTNGQRRSGEQLVEDRQGRKRRKLDLSNNTTQALAPKAERTDGYLSDSSFSVPAIFFGKTAYGRELEEPQMDDGILERHKHGESGEESFQFVSPIQPAGIRQIIYSRIFHFFNNAEKFDLQRDGKAAAAVLPYRRDDEAETTHSAMVVQFKGSAGVPIATREHAAALDRQDAETEAESNDQSPSDDKAGEWDFLMDKYKGEDGELLKAYGDADGDGEAFTITASEVEREQGSLPEAEEVSESVDGGLGSKEVDTIIETFIKDHTERWIKGLPILEGRKAWTTWNKMKKSRTLRAELIRSAQARVTHITARLVRAKQDMLADQWSDQYILRQACRNLEGFVEDREEERWKISIWQRRQEPFHQVRRGQRRSTTTTVAAKQHAPPFVLDAADRMDYVQAVQEANEDLTDSNEIIYEADDEFHTPEGALLADGEVLPSTSPHGDFIVKDSESDHEFFLSDDRNLANGMAPGALSDSSYFPESEDELVSPSQLVVKLPLSKSKSKTPITSSPATPARKVGDFDVDLTQLPSDSPAPKRRGRPRKNLDSNAQTPTKQGRAVVPYDYDNGQPLEATGAEIATWDIKGRIAARDRTRLLILLIRGAGPDVRYLMKSLHTKLKTPRFQAELITSCKSLSPQCDVQSTMHLLDVQTMEHARDIYIAWYTLNPSETPQKSLSQKELLSISESASVRNFVPILARILSKDSLFEEPTAKTGSSAAPLLISSSSDNETEHQQIVPSSTPRKVRKRAVHVDKMAQQTRASAAERQRRYDESQGATDPDRLALMIGSDVGISRVEINPVRDQGHDAIYIPDRIARQMKAHQIDGTRFLWREITASGSDGEQGCILAHNMGLGKTMQTITLLITLDEVAHSRKKSERSQLPNRLRADDIAERKLRFLVICPPSLLQNWRREIDRWALTSLGDSFSLESANKTFHLQILEEWMRLGGVLLIGYQMFRNSVLDESTKAKKKLEGEGAQRIKDVLLNGAELVVADEAHYLKNDKSGVAKACDQIVTESRIGLTGTPMSNDVQEIFALLSFVAPGFLGDSVEFKAHYAEPIQDGLWDDSTYAEKRRSLMKLKVLHAEIQPKVHRANIEVLRGSLKPKVEFVLTVPLGVLQNRLYCKTVAALVGGGRNENATTVAIFGWLSVLTLLTNHPHCFREKLMAPVKQRNKIGKGKRAAARNEQDNAGSASSDDHPTPEDSEAGTLAVSVMAKTGDRNTPDADLFEKPVRALGFTEEMIAEIVKEFDDSMDATLSAKTGIFLELLGYCLACKDKVLVFSSSILTLDFLGLLLAGHNHKYGRIDGSTPMNTRTTVLEEFHKDRFYIMLVSTRAGGVGLNIQGANRVFIFDFGFNPTHEEQAIGRAYRLGQTKPVFVYRFVAGGTFERNIYNRQLFKTSLAQRVVDKKNPRRNAERKTRDYLYPPMETKQEDLTEWIGKDSEVLDKLLAQHGEGVGKKDIVIRAIKTMETLQEDAMDAPLDEAEQIMVNQEIAEGRKRPKGRKGATHGMGYAATQASRQPMPDVNFHTRPPPSTYAGPSYAGYHMGGLPIVNGGGK